MRPEAATSAIRAQLIAALERRTATLDGEARRVVDVRLAELRVRDATASNETPRTEPEACATGPLRQLTDQFTREAPNDRSTYPDIPALAELRQLWSTLRADSQLQQCVVHPPTDAGPLNSAALASRAIALMRELSPGYLRSFLAYVDDLAWLEQLGTAAPATGPGAKKKRTPRKPRL
jgi:hypothetical protein